MNTKVPLRHRLLTRQALPVLAGFTVLLGLLLALGYLYLQRHILETAHLQIQQLVGSIARQDDYSRQWIERGMGALTGLARTLPELSSAQWPEADARMTGMISDQRGRQTVDVRYFDSDGVLHWRRYGSTGLLETAIGAAAAGIWTEKKLRIYNAPLWHKPAVSADRTLTLSYCASLRHPNVSAHTPAQGMVCVNLDMPWFLGRVHALSHFKDCQPFFLTSDGGWTLPGAADSALEALRKYMLHTVRGEMSVVWNGIPYTAVFTPLRDQQLRMGVLIPDAELFGRLDRLSGLLAGLGCLALLLATCSLYHTCAVYLQPLGPLGRLAERLSRGELDMDGTDLPRTSYQRHRLPRVTERIRRASEQLRGTLRQRVQDLTLMARTRERLLGELAFARTLQESLRPPDLEPAPDLHVAAFVHTADTVCGDMYDYFWLHPRQLCCVIGNVAERGVPAALNTGRCIPLLHELLLSGASPGKALSSVNRVLAPATIMVNALTGILDLDSGTFQWASAGQQPPFRYGNSLPLALAWSGNVPLGVRSDEIYQEMHVSLTPGEGLLFVGQRLLFVQDGQGADYGEKGITHFLRTHGHEQECAVLLQTLYNDVCHFAGGSLPEDLTCFALRRC